MLGAMTVFILFSCLKELAFISVTLFHFIISGIIRFSVSFHGLNQVITILFHSST